MASRVVPTIDFSTVPDYFGISQNNPSMSFGSNMSSTGESGVAPSAAPSSFVSDKTVLSGGGERGDSSSGVGNCGDVEAFGGGSGAGDGAGGGGSGGGNGGRDERSEGLAKEPSSSPAVEAKAEMAQAARAREEKCSSNSCTASEFPIPRMTPTPGLGLAWAKRGFTSAGGLVAEPTTASESAAGGDEGEMHISGFNEGRHMKFKTVAGLPSMMRQHLSYAEEHAQDVSAEINSLSKISAEDEDEEMNRFMLHHESSEKLMWDIVMMMLIVFSSFVNPLQIGFDRDPHGFLWVFEVLVDFVFIADVCLTFRTTVSDHATKETISDAKVISVRYLKGWFVLDCVSSLPVVLLSRFVESTGHVQQIFLTLKLLRTLKLHQLSVITNGVLQRFEDQDFNPAVFRIYIFVLAFILVVHFIACGYWFVARLTDPDFTGNWSPEEDYLDDVLYRQYVRALYFALVITYGNDLRPDSDIGYAFSNICLALALLTNAVIIGSATNLLSNMDAGAVAKKTQMDGINGYMRYRKVPQPLQKKIRMYYEYLWESGQDSYSASLFEDMPEKLKLQFNISLKKRLIEKVPLFKTFSPAGTIALVQNLVASIILPGELIVRQGEPATSMFFISRGTVRVFVLSESEDTTGPSEESYIISLGAGSFFGEVALLEDTHLRTASVKAETFTELQVMHAQDFHALAKVFPEFETAVQAISQSRKKAGEALGKMKARNKMTAANKKSVRSPLATSRAKMLMRDAVLTMKAKETSAGEPESRIPKLRIWVERLMRVKNRTPVTARNEALVAAASLFTASGRGATSRRAAGREPRSVYETIVAHEALVSHEAALRVARGGGISAQDLLTMNAI